MRADIKERIAMIERGEVPEGYKDSLLGIIPRDWSVCDFKEITDILRCGIASTPDYVEEGIPFLSSQNVKESKLVLKQYNFISKDYHKKLTKNSIVKKGDILYTRVGANYGLAAVVDIDFEFSIYVSLTHIRMKVGYDNVFYSYVLNSDRYKNLARQRVFQGGGVPNLNVKVVEKFKMISPQYSEQQKIGSFIHTWDRAIEIKEKLLEQKKLQKKGLIERLLTGKMRLPGFKDEWKYLKAGAIFSNSSNKKHGGIGEVLSSMQDRGIVPRSQVDIDIKYDLDSVKSYKQVNAADFVISLRSFQGGIEYSDYDGLISPAYTVLKNKMNIDVGFYKELFKSVNFIRRLNSVIYGIRDGKQIGYDDFSTLKLPYPPQEEQRAIAKVFKVANDEMTLLQSEIDQLKTQKKGLMQLLITGKVRVPC